MEMNHTTTADKGEQECREAFEQWVLESWDATHLRTDRVGTYVCLHIFLRWQAWQAAWNRRPTNEGQDGLREPIKRALNLYAESYEMMTRGDDDGSVSCKNVALDIRQNFTDSIMHAIARHLSSKQADSAERNFCPTCGKRLNTNDVNAVHTCSPPTADHTEQHLEMVKADAVKMPEPVSQAVNLPVVVYRLTGPDGHTFHSESKDTAEWYGTHELKVWPTYFQQVKAGTKTFEVRKDDRDFNSGDRLILREYEPAFGYTGDVIERGVGFILRGPEWGIAEGYCVMSLASAPAIQPQAAAPIAEQTDGAETVWSIAGRLALELECLLLDTKDTAIVSKWWDTAHEALEDYRLVRNAAPCDCGQFIFDRCQALKEKNPNIGCKADIQFRYKSPSSPKDCTK